MFDEVSLFPATTLAPDPPITTSPRSPGVRRVAVPKFVIGTGLFEVVVVGVGFATTVLVSVTVVAVVVDVVDVELVFVRPFNTSRRELPEDVVAPSAEDGT